LKPTAPIATSATALLLVSLWFWDASPVSAAALSLQVMPNTLPITESFRGAPLSISADITAGANAVVELKGDAHEAHLLRKGRRGGLWMNVGEVEVHGAPSLYLAMSTDPEILASQGNQGRWGYPALQKKVEFSGVLPKGGAALLFEQLVKLKEDEGLYGVFPGSLKKSIGSGGRAKVEGQFMLPSNLPPGKYRVTLSVVNSGSVLDKQSAELTVRMAGLTAIMASLAHEHALLYGVLSVVIAVLTGFIMGFVFKGKGGAH